MQKDALQSLSGVLLPATNTQNILNSLLHTHAIYWCKEDISDIEHSKKSLRDHDVIVEKVDYDEKLSPSFEEQCRASVTPPPMPEASMPSSIEATPPPTDHTSHRLWNTESDMKLTLEKLQNLDIDKQLTPMKGDTNNAQDTHVLPQRPMSLPFYSDSPWEGLSQAESTESDLGLHSENDEWQLHTKEQNLGQKVPVLRPMHLPYKSDSPWEGLSQTESTEGDLNLHDEDEWPLLTKEQKIE